MDGKTLQGWIVAFLLGILSLASTLIVYLLIGLPERLTALEGTANGNKSAIVEMKAAAKDRAKSVDRQIRRLGRYRLRRTPK